MIIPIEVNPSIHVRSRSLHSDMKAFQPKDAIRISRKNFRFENEIKIVLLYATFYINKNNLNELQKLNQEIEKL